MVNKNEIILYKIKHKQIGKRHDYKIYKMNHPVTPKEVENVLDLGFLGVEKDYPEQISSLPIKKKRGQDLILEEKKYNRIHSKKRIIIEMPFIDKKVYDDEYVFRNRLRKYESFGHSFRISKLQDNESYVVQTNNNFGRCVNPF